MSKKSKKIVPEKLLPIIIFNEEENVKIFDAIITGAKIFTRNLSIDNEVDVVLVKFTRLFRDDDIFDEEDEVILANDEYFYFDYEFELDPSSGSLYSQLLTSVFYEKDLPASDFSIDTLKSSIVKLVIGNRGFLKEVRPFTEPLTEKMREYNLITISVNQ